MTKRNIEETLLETYTEELSGLPYPILLINSVTEKRDAETGEVLGHGIRNLPGLLAAAGLARLLEPVRLSGQELKFVRKTLDLKAKELAEAVNITPETLSKMENDHDGIGEYSERMIRLYACDVLAKRAPAIDYNAGMITGMKVQKHWPGGEVPTFAFCTLKMKDSVTRKLSKEWDIGMAA